MYASHESLVAMNKAQFEALLAAAHVGVETAQRVAGLNVAATTRLMSEALTGAHAMAEGKTPQLTPALAEIVSSYPHQLLEIFQVAQGEILKLMDSGMGQFNREALETTEKSLLHGAFPGGEWVATGVRNAVGAAVSSVDALQLLFKQFSDVSEASLKASTAVPVTPAATAPRKRAA